MYRAKSNLIESASNFIDYLSIIQASNNFNCLLFDEAIITDLKYSNLPPRLEISSLDGIRINDMHLTGRLRLIDWKSIEKVFLGLENSVGMSGRVDIAIRYKEQPGELSNDGDEYAYITVECGKYYFGYSAGGTRIALDREHAIETLDQIIKVLELPVIIETEKDYYTIKHTRDLGIELNHSFLGRNPASFTCEIPNIKAADLIEKLKYFEESIIWSKVLDVKWTAGHSVRQDSMSSGTDKVIEIYNSVIDSNPPALQYSMGPNFDVTDLNGIKTIQYLCTENNIVTTRFGIVDFSGAKALLSIAICHDGYHIEAGTKDKSVIDQLASLLNIQFERN